MMQKNTASQKWICFAFDRTTNAAKTGDANNITANLRIDGGGADAVDDTNPTELEDGYYCFDLAQPETNGDMILISPQSSTSDVQVIGVPGVVFTTAPGINALALSSGKVTVGTNDDKTGYTLTNLSDVNAGKLGAFMGGLTTGTAVEDVYSPTTTIFETGLSEPSDDHYNGLAIFFVSGNLTGQSSVVKDYYIRAVNQEIEVDPAFTEAPANGDDFVILPIRMVPEQLSAQAKADVNAEADAALSDVNLDHLLKTATAAADMTDEMPDNTILARLMAGGDTSSFIPGTHDLKEVAADTNELQTNQGNWLTATGFSTHDAAAVKTAMEADGSKLTAAKTAAQAVDTLTKADGAGDLAAVLADTDELQTDDVPGLIGALNNLSQANVRTAVGLASANLDAQIGDVKAKTDNLPASPAAVGSAMTLAAGEDVYHADVFLTRDTLNGRDEYTVQWYKNGSPVTAGVTDPTLRVVRRSDGTDFVAAVAMDQVGTTGTCKHDSDVRLAAGEAAVAVVGATIDGAARAWRRAVGRDV